MQIQQREKLVGDLVQRLWSQGGSYRVKRAVGVKLSQEDLHQHSIAQGTEDTLITLSKTALDSVVSALLEKITKGKVNDETQLQFLDIIGNCLSTEWEKIRPKMQLQADVEGIIEPPSETGRTTLSNSLADKLLSYVQATLMKCASSSSSSKTNDEAIKSGRILFNLSALKPDIVPRITGIVGTGVEGKDTEELANQYFMIEDLNLNQSRLDDLLTKASQVTSLYSKSKGNLQYYLVRVLRRAIWNWIDNYPIEFVHLCQASQTIPAAPVLFDVFESWSSSGSKKELRKDLLPLQTMLLLLCPGEMLKIAMGKDKPDPAKEKFLDTLKKSLKGKLSDISAVCYVDIWKAATFVPKSEVNALRYMIPAVESDLNEKLFDPKAPVKKSDGETDLDLMTQCLVSSFRLSPAKAHNSLCIECLKPDVPSHFKVVLIRGLLQIAREGSSLPWNPTISDAYHYLATPLRSHFQEFVRSANSYDQLSSEKSDKKTKQQQDKLLSDTLILQDLITLFNVDPGLPLFPMDTVAQNLDSTKNLLIGLCECVAVFSLPELSDRATQTLLDFHQTKHIEQWCVKNVMDGFWDISSAVNSTLASVLISKVDIKPTQALKVITILEDILTKRNDFLRTHQSQEVSPKNNEAKTLSSNKLEVALLMNLCSGDPDICTKSATCFGLLCDEIDILGSEQGNVIASNYSIYRKLASSGVLSTGRVAQQLAIRRLLRGVENPTSGNFGAWQEVYDRWVSHTKGVLVLEEEGEASTGTAPGLIKKKSTKDIAGALPKLLQGKEKAEIQEEWRNYTGFLVALSGVCLNKEQKIKVPPDSKSKTKAPTEKAVKVIESFVDEILEYLVADSKYVREAVMSLTGTSISHVAYPVLFSHLSVAMQKSFSGDKGQVHITKEFTLFVDQSINLVKHIIELPQDTDNLSLLSDFEVLLQSFVRYVSNLVVDDLSLGIKKRTCLLLQSMMAKRQYISFRNELKFRNDLVATIMEWTSDFTKSGENQRGRPTITKQGSTGLGTSFIEQSSKAFSELDIEVMKGIGSLLRGLPLDSGDSKNLERKKASFVKYFTFFTKLLSRCKVEAKSSTTESLAECTIQCLSNLLAANIDSGLEFFVTMGYHEDFATRTAFLKVIKNILNQGAEFDQIGDVGDKYDKLLQLLFESDGAVVLALCEAVQITEADDVAALLVRIFEANDKVMQLLRSSIGAEIARTDQSSTLFRRNSMSTKLLAAYSKVNGQEYLREILTPALQVVISNPDNYEVDPARLPKGQKIEDNIANLIQVSQQFLDSVINSVDRCPLQFREICHFLNKAVHDRFPGFENAAIGGFLFLRFICPAIVSPEGFGLIKELPNPEARRGLVLVTKTIQNLANGVTFQLDKKEPYMVSMNTFIEKNGGLLAEAIQKFATLPSNVAGHTAVSIPDEQREIDLGLIHRHLTANLEKLGRSLQSADQKTRSPTFDRLTAMLEKLGPPPEVSNAANKATSVRPTTSGAKDNSFFDSFMKTKANTNTDKVKEKNIFYRQGSTKEKLPVFYLIARRYINNDSDVELDPLLFFILKTLVPCLGKPFVLVVDCTLFSPQNQLPLSWCSYFLKHFPKIGGDNLERIILINPNAVFKKYSQSIRNLIGRTQLKKIVFVPNVLKLTDHIPESELALPDETLAIEKDVRASFSPVLKVSSQYSQNEIVLRVSGDYMQTVTARQHPILGKNASLLELVHVSTVKEITHFPEDGEIVVKYVTATDVKTITFRSTSSLQIIERINASKNLHKLTAIEVSSRQVSNPADVPGTLLNMALLNLGTESESLRSAAYSMLDALCTNFNFSVRLQLLGTNGLCIPTNSFHFVVTLSEKLALNQPNLTLEFLLECLQGLKLSKAASPLKHLCLDYMRPWFPNLSRFCHLSSEPDSAEKVAKTKEVIDSLITFTVKETAIMTVVLSTVWVTIGTVTDILETVIDCCIQQSVESGYGSQEVEVIGSIVATIAAQNQQLVSGKIIARLLALVSSTSSAVINQLEEHQSWPAITVHLRLLFMLTFDNLIHVQQYLPELFHIVMMLFSTGSSSIRATIHGLLINVIHSLYTLKITSDNKLQSLRFHMSELSQPKSKLLFGIGGQAITAFTKLDGEAKSSDKLSLSTVETVATELFSVLSAVSPMNDPTGTTWHARWLSLTAKTAFTSNTALQPRASITMGVLCKSESLVTDELVESILVTLKEALRDITYDGGEDLAVSLLFCLNHIYEYLTPKSFYFYPLFWVAMSIVKTNDMKLFNASICLVETIIKVQDFHGCYSDKMMEEVLNSSREGPIDQIVLKLDNNSGLSFKSNFSFAVAGHLLKGMKHPTSKENTARVLGSFLDISAKSKVGSNILGYITALLPFENDLPVLRDLAVTSGGKDVHQSFYTEQLLPDDKHCALLFTTLVAILSSSEKEYEQIFICDALKEGAKFNADAFDVVEELLFPMLTATLNTSQNPYLLESVHSIMKSTWAHRQARPTPTMTRKYLDSIEFNKLPDCSTFIVDATEKRETTKLVILLLENLLQEIRGKSK